MNEHSEKDLWYYFYSAVSQNSVALYKGGRSETK